MCGVSSGDGNVQGRMCAHVIPTPGSPREKWLKAFWVSDLAACEKSCEDEAKCQSITFRKDWTNNCNHFETKCMYRQPQSMAIAKTLKDKKPDPTGICSDPNAVCSCKAGFTINADQTKCLGA